MQNNFVSIINNSKTVLIMLPTNPNFDQVAAGLSLFLSLSKIKPVSIYSPTPITVEFNRLIGVNKISQDLGNKNMVISFADYDANDIEKVSYDIEEGQFQLTVLPKEGVAPPASDKVRINYSGLSSDTVIIIGGSNESNFPDISKQEFSSANIVHVGIQQISLSANKNYVSFTRVGSSVSEIAYGVIRENKLFIDADISTNLIMGVESIVGKGFEGQGITAETFYTYADLLQYGAKMQANVAESAGTYPPGAIPGAVMTPAAGGQPVMEQTQSSLTQAQLPTQFNVSTNPQNTVDSQQTLQNIGPNQAQFTVGNQPAFTQTETVKGQNLTQAGDEQSDQDSKKKEIKDNQQQKDDQNPPKEWTQQPKVYKGSSGYKN